MKDLGTNLQYISLFKDSKEKGQKLNTNCIKTWIEIVDLLSIWFENEIQFASCNINRDNPEILCWEIITMFSSYARSLHYN